MDGSENGAVGGGELPAKTPKPPKTEGEKAAKPEKFDVKKEKSFVAEPAKSGGKTNKKKVPAKLKTVEGKMCLCDLSFSSQLSLR